MGDSEYPRRRGLRLREYDYARPGAYFVTVCVEGRRCVLGAVDEEQVRLSGIGEIVQACWREIPAHFAGVENGAFVVMPNHVHGIIEIIESPVATAQASPGERRLRPRSVGAIVGSFKAAASKRVKEAGLLAAGPLWQRGFHEHVVRNEQDLRQIREYIANNPLKWHLDRENPGRS